jgi:hypothetical protein
VAGFVKVKGKLIIWFYQKIEGRLLIALNYEFVIYWYLIPNENEK